ncbi:MAG: fibronectin type III domain-containing protein [Prolixibacteraceae bacterium]|nr:fibronectin type III domain-containing protein [Prolixibacteraceae bacterium]
MKFLIFCLIFIFIGTTVKADKLKRLQKRASQASSEFAKKASEGTVYKFRPDTFSVDFQAKKVNLKMKESFSYIPFRPENTSQYYNWYKDLLGRKFRKYSVSIESMGKDISELIPNYYRGTSVPIDANRLSKPAQAVIPIVRNSSKNQSPPKGLTDRNVAMWQSHGWYYENTLDRWEWQRARVFLTVEDLWTMSFVVPYITPMLENAGANVFLARERDIQKHEIIIDDDGSSKGSAYEESGEAFQQGKEKGFGLKVPFLLEGENLFQMGETRQMAAKKLADARINYTPEIPETGDYAVYVSYARNDQNVTDAHYTVYHSGGKTELLVNQTIGGGTWVFLGTFRFEKGLNIETGKVELSNLSVESGKQVSVDAVRFGGGMGNVVRGKLQDMERLQKLRNEKGFALDSSAWLPYASKRPRYQEGARYYLQYVGMPDTLVYMLNKEKIDYSNRGQDAALYAKRESGKNDYKDDYQSRGEWVNYLMGAPNGPTGNPNAKGLGIPVDMAMAFHTDAGTTPDSAIIGSLVIYDTTYGKPEFPNGQSRWASRDLCDLVQTQVVDDLRKLYEPEWTRRGMWNKQYSESLRPKVPTMLSELLSHQNFADMYQAYDPRFKFDVSRAYYKGILKFLASQNNQDYVVQPLPVSHFRMNLEGSSIRLSWRPVQDPLEPTATPKSYRIYSRTEHGGFDNGKTISDTTDLISGLKPGLIYSFKITAVNEGGESFPSEILACSLPADGKKPVLIVNGFDRISGPEAFDNGKYAGFSMAEDEGVAYKNDIAFIGEQYDFDRKSPWKDDDASGFGSSHADQETRIVQGNTFDYPLVHGEAFRNNGMGFISMSDEAFEQQNWDKNAFAALDLIFGEEKTVERFYGYKKRDFTVFTPKMRTAITEFTSAEGAKVFVSGAYIGTDLQLCGDTLAKKFAADVLHFRFMTNHASRSGGIYPVNDMKSDFSTEISFVQGYHPEIYKVESPDAIEPKGDKSKVLFRYQVDNKTAGVCYNGSYRTVVLGFPFETITTTQQRTELMGQVLKYWGLK